MQWKDLDQAVRKDRQTTIFIRGLKKRIAMLEEKLLLIREATTLWDRGEDNSTAPGGIRVRQQRRIDVLEAKLLVIRELSSMAVANEQKGGESSRRQCVETRIRRGGKRVTAAEAGAHANLAVDKANENFQTGGARDVQ